MNKKQRSKSCLENYNKRIKQILGPNLSEKRKTVIPWPLLLTFIKNEEHYYSGLIKHKLASDIVHDPDNNFTNLILNMKKKIIIIYHLK